MPHSSGLCDLPSSDAVQVGPFLVADLPCDELVSNICDRWLHSERSRPLTAFALHVGGLNNRGNRDFVESMRCADVVYADGGSVVGLAKLAGAERVERASTTDMGWGLFKELEGRLGRRPQVALVGGAPCLAERAADVFEATGAATVVMAEHGYHTEWSAVTKRLRDCNPDVCVVGMGAPREMLWVSRELDQLPPAIILTCGGWFGFVTGDEKRAPGPLRRAGLEWTARVAQSPRRLGRRYAAGAWSCLAVLPGVISHRVQRA